METLLLIALGILVVWFFKTQARKQTAAVPSNASGRAVFYRTRDGLGNYGFSFERQADGSYRAYITSMPSYGGRDQSPNTTHRLADRGRYYIHWRRPLRSEDDARQVAALWADLTQEYIRTGRAIDEGLALTNDTRGQQGKTFIATPDRLCPVCGLENPTQTEHCDSCGTRLRPSSTGQPRPLGRVSNGPDLSQNGWMKIEGKVVIPPQHSNVPRFQWRLFLTQSLVRHIPLISIVLLVLLFIFAPSFLIEYLVSPILQRIFLPILLPILIFTLLLSMLGLGSRFNVVGLLLGLFSLRGLSRSLEESVRSTGPVRTLMPVQDFVVQDQHRKQFQVRIEGQVVSGAVFAHHEVELEGVNHHGTLLFKRGRNKTTNAQIVVRRQAGMGAYSPTYGGSLL